MQVTIDKNEQLAYSRVRVGFTVPAEEVGKYYKAALTSFGSSVSIKGFRKGKVPEAVLEQRFGDDILAQANESTTTAALDEIVRQGKIRMMTIEEPQLKLKKEYAKDKPLAGVFEFDVYPDVRLEKFTGITVSVPHQEVKVTDVQRELTKLRNDRASLEPLETERAVKSGDDVLVDHWEKQEDGSEGNRKNGVHVVIDKEVGGDDAMALVGLKKGEEKQVPSGRVVRVVGIYKRNLPAMDDEFAQSLGSQFPTIAELKKQIREELQRNYDAELERNKRNALLDVIIEAAVIDLPRSMVSAELERMFGMVAQQNRIDRQGLLQKLNEQGRTLEGLFDSWRPEAERNLRETLSLLEIGQQQKIDVDFKEVETYIQTRIGAAGSAEERERLEKLYGNKEVIDSLHSYLREQKTVEYLFGANTCNIDKNKK